MYYLCSGFQTWRYGASQELSQILLSHPTNMYSFGGYDLHVLSDETPEYMGYREVQIHPDRDEQQDFLKDYVLVSFHSVDFSMLISARKLVSSFCVAE